MYLEYAKYKGYGGSLDNSTFSRIEYKAEKIVDAYTLGRLKNDTEFSESVTRCVYELIELLQEHQGKEVTSVSVDGYSESYKDFSEADYGTLIKDYLFGETNQDGEDLIYSGVI